MGRRWFNERRLFIGSQVRVTDISIFMGTYERIIIIIIIGVRRISWSWCTDGVRVRVYMWGMREGRVAVEETREEAPGRVQILI